MKIKFRPKVWVILIATSGFAQQAPFTPAPRILQIYREQMIQGHEADYLRIETNAVATESRLNFQHSYLTFQGVNRSSDIWFVNGYDSYAELEQLEKQIAANAELSSALNEIGMEKAGLSLDSHTIFARYREDLSFGRGLSGQRTRYFVISVVSLKPGHTRDYAEIRRILRGAHERAGSAEIHSVYQLESGMSDGTFLIFTPATTLEDAGNGSRFDQETFDNDLDTQARARLRDLSDAALLQSETEILRIDPSMSFPAPEWRDADPEFWNPAK